MTARFDGGVLVCQPLDRVVIIQASLNSKGTK